jgi:hypothetical protein
VHHYCGASDNNQPAIAAGFSAQRLPRQSTAPTTSENQSSIASRNHRSSDQLAANTPLTPTTATGLMNTRREIMAQVSAGTAGMPGRP